MTTKKQDIESKIKKALEDIRPMLQADGGDLQFVSWIPESGTVNINLMGMCAHCPMSQVTLKQGIEEELKKKIPEVKSVERV